MTEFKTILYEALPHLDENLNAAYQEYMDHRIPAGAFRYIQFRHALAYTMANRLSDGTVAETDAMEQCAHLVMDIETAPAPGDLCGRWMVVYDAAGFTARHRMFGYPVRPKEAVVSPSCEPA